MLQFVKIRDMTLYVKKSSTKTSLIPAWVGGQMAISDLLSESLRKEIDICQNINNSHDYINKELISLLPIFFMAMSKNSVRVPFSITSDPSAYASPKYNSGKNNSL